MDNIGFPINKIHKLYNLRPTNRRMSNDLIIIRKLNGFVIRLQFRPQITDDT